MRMRHMTSVTRPLLEKRTIKVPTMGDSITEVRSCLKCYCRTSITYNFFRRYDDIFSRTNRPPFFLLKGTIVEWTAEIGQAVKDGDVIALVETDKVTIEIKAQIDGVITQKFGAV